MSWEATVIRDCNTDCWHWAGYLTEHGYGVRTRNKRRYLAHRLSYEDHKGAIPHGLTLDHLCRNRACVNPAHLEPKTIGENVLCGEGIAVQNKRKTHCKNGHLFNRVIARRGGERVCVTCSNERQRKRRSTAKENVS